MSGGHAVMRQWIEQINSLVDAPQAIAPVVATKLRAEIEGNIAAGRGPDGTPWQPTKAGKRPLQNAAKALTVVAQGTVIVAAIVGPEALHHWGAVTGGIKRQILPTRDIPQPVVTAIQTAWTERCAKVLG